MPCPNDCRLQHHRAAALAGGGQRHPLLGGLSAVGACAGVVGLLLQSLKAPLAHEVHAWLQHTRMAVGCVAQVAGAAHVPLAAACLGCALHTLIHALLHCQERSSSSLHH